MLLHMRVKLKLCFNTTTSLPERRSYSLFGMEELDRPVQQFLRHPISSNDSGMTWNLDCEPGLISQHRHAASLTRLWVNGRKVQSLNILNVEGVFKRVDH